jgi:hypothetical protein
MNSFDFMERFADQVASGEKRQTIRKPRKTQLKEGDEVHLFTGMRTDHCRKLGVGRLIQVMPLIINAESVVDLTKKRYPRLISTIGECENFAELDGFPFWASFRDFFLAKYGLPFTGTLYRWRLIGIPGLNTPVKRTQSLER